MSVAANKTSVIAFVIKPTKIGSIRINIVAQSSGIADAIFTSQQAINPEGIIQYIASTTTIDLRDSFSFSQTYNMATPPVVIPDSTKGYLSAIGNPLPAIVSDLSDLIKLNQNFQTLEDILLVLPINVAVANYLTVTKQTSVLTQYNLIQVITSTYQTLLTYQNSNGGFSTNKPANNFVPSIWLTAFAVKTMNKIKSLIQINSQVMTNACNYIVNNQNPKTGIFTEQTAVINNNLMGGNSVYNTLNVFIVTTLIETNPTLYSQEITRGVNYILKQNIDTYTLAWFTYALQLGQLSQRSVYMGRLVAQVKKSTNGYAWWEINGSGDPSLATTSTVNIEASACACMALIAANQPANAQYVGKWLSKQRNVNNAFVSVQDISLGVEALTQLAKLGGSIVLPQVTINTKYTNQQTTYNISPKNYTILKEYNVSIIYKFILIFDFR